MLRSICERGEHDARHAGRWHRRVGGMGAWAGPRSRIAEASRPRAPLDPDRATADLEEDPRSLEAMLLRHWPTTGWRGVSLGEALIGSRLFHAAALDDERRWRAPFNHEGRRWHGTQMAKRRGSSIFAPSARGLLPARDLGSRTEPAPRSNALRAFVPASMRTPEERE